MLPTSGAISLSAIRTELSVNVAHPTLVSLAETASRTLAVKVSGAVKASDFRSKYTQRPQVDAYIYDTSVAFNAFTSAFVPPTMLDVFNTWGRFAANTWFPNGSTPTGEAASWQFNSTLQRPECTANTVGYTGFVSNSTLSDFSFEAVLSSTDTDDDILGLVAAFKNNGTNNVGIFVLRSVGGMGVTNCWTLVKYSAGVATNLVNGSSLANQNVPTTSNNGQGWAALGPTKIKVQRSGNIISATCSQFGSTVLDPTTAISFDLTADTTTAALSGAQSYGYVAMSQTAATFTNAVIDGGLAPDYAYNMATGVVSKYNTATSTWVTQAQTIAQQLGYPRLVRNPSTGFIFSISPTGVVTPV